MIDVRPLAQRPHHQAHLAPVAEALGVSAGYEPGRAGRASVALVASYGDLARARRLGYQRIVLMQHGAGQSYGGDSRTARHPAYPGGDDNDQVGLFLTPNEHSAERWRQRYPSAAVEVVGCPRLEALPARARGGELTAAVSFHWNYHGIPEMRSAFAYFWPALEGLAQRVRLIGHSHPKRHDLAAWYPAHGIEFVPAWDDVLRRADVYICDNSSTMFEFASTGRPVLALEAPWYRREAQHGLRFWDAEFRSVREPGELVAAVEDALAAPSSWQPASEQVARLAYACQAGAAQRAAEAIRSWAA